MNITKVSPNVANSRRTYCETSASSSERGGAFCDQLIGFGNQSLVGKEVTRTSSILPPNIRMASRG